jgi:UDP-N-acetylglucosamine--N-acetylmuramyl-(pentapeptide) pyrophosphoryl-undecaprenol N-acetylglucosamine transferase
MRILLIGGGSGGHITPLLAVAHELKQLDDSLELIGVCEKGCKFVGLFENDANIARVIQVSAGKYRRYAGLKWYQRWFDIKTLLLNVRDVGRTLKGKRQARKLLKELRPDILLIKGGFVAVPMGLAAGSLGIPYITHDSDSTPGLANRLISKKAAIHATGMPAELYSYPKDRTVYTGIPLSDKFQHVTAAMRDDYRKELGISEDFVITVVGGSQGGERLNKDVVAISKNLMERFPSLGILHIAGEQKAEDTEAAYSAKLSDAEQGRVRVKGFVDNPQTYTGAADVVISRAGATVTAELALQGVPMIMVPGQLAGAHQAENADFFVAREAALKAEYGDSEGLFNAVISLLVDEDKRRKLALNLNAMAKPRAARELAELTLETARKQKG